MVLYAITGQKLNDNYMYTLFSDNYTGNRLKTPHQFIILNLSYDAAVIAFKDIFKVEPFKRSCDCPSCKDMDDYNVTECFTKESVLANMGMEIRVLGANHQDGVNKIFDFIIEDEPERIRYIEIQQE